MANENRYFSTPFAENGDKAEVPNVSVGGAVGYDTGFGPNYELPQGDVDRKRIERDLYNGMHNSITKNLKQWQEELYPTWIEDNGTGVAYSYSKGMIVSHSGSFWISVANSNQDEPLIASSKWKSYDANFDLPALASTVEIPSLSGNVVEDQLIKWQGYYEQSDGGGNSGVVKFGAHTADGGSIFSIDSNTYIEANLRGKKVNALKFGVKRSLTYDEGTIASFESSDEFKKAQAWCESSGQNLRLPAGYYYYDGVIDLGSFDLCGDGIGQTFLLCHPDGSRGYFIGNENTILSRGMCALRGIEIVCFDWDNPSFGSWFSRPIQIKEVMIRNFAYSGCFMSHDLSQNGPYYSTVDTLFCDRNGEHGFVLGAGANAVTIKNYVGRWNGTQTIGQTEPPAGDYDGFIATSTGDDRVLVGIPTYTPESLDMSGGDCSYNSRYGWNIDNLQTSSNVNLGYTELNKGPNQIRIAGGTRSCTIQARHGSSVDLGTSEVNSSLFPNKIYTTQGDMGTGYIDTGSTKPMDNQATHDVLYSSGSAAIIKIVKDSEGRVTYVGSGFNPTVSYSSTMIIDNKGTHKTTAYSVNAGKITYNGGVNSVISLEGDANGNLMYSRIGSQASIYFNGVDPVIQSPNGSYFRIKVSDGGVLSTVPTG